MRRCLIITIAMLILTACQVQATVEDPGMELGDDFRHLVRSLYSIHSRLSAQSLFRRFWCSIRRGQPHRTGIREGISPIPPRERHWTMWSL